MEKLVRLVPAWCWWLIALVLVAGGQQYRVVVAQGETAEARTELSDYRLEVAERDRRAAARPEPKNNAVRPWLMKRVGEQMSNTRILKAGLLLLSLGLSACAVKSPDCAQATEQPAIPSLPSSARQEPLPSWCSGDCLKSLTEWRETSRKRLSEVE